MGKPYKRAVLFSGGGTRLAIYGGVFAALEDSGMRPDLLIASCGGAFAATVINAFATNKGRKAYLQSEEYYRFIIQTRLTQQKKISKLGWYIFKKQLDKRNAFYIEDVFNRYLVNMPQHLSGLLPSLNNISFSKEISTIIIGSTLLFNPSETGKPRRNKKLYQKTLLTDCETAKQVCPDKIKIGTDNYVHSAVAEDMLVKTDISMLPAARISISDMFYVSPVLLGQEYYAGGAVDLVPVELAQALADEMILEKKQPYTHTEEALVRAVLGFSGNRRLQEIEQVYTGLQIDTRDAAQYLNGHYCKKKINWQQLEISISLPTTLTQFQEDIEKQWQYGYQRTLEGINS